MAHDLDTQPVDYVPADQSSDSGNGRRREPGASVDHLTPHRRRWPWLVAGLAVGGAATFAVTARGGDEADTDPLLQESVELTTVQVSSQDLVEEVEWAGTLSSGLTIGVPAPVDGVVTAAAETGVTVERGDVVAELDGEPVVTLFGDIPMWRELSEGDEGEDVRQLEANLVHLGYDPDGEVTVDHEFTSATENMVERWEEDLGLEETGRVPMSRVVVLPGPTEIVTAPIVGSSAKTGSDLLSVDALATRVDVIGWETEAGTEGEITFVADVGTAVEHGTVLYTADGIDAVAVVDVDEVTGAVLDAMWSADVELLESVLVYTGFDPESLIEIDDEVDLHTVAAVVRWQESAGLPATGSADPSDYVVVTGAADAPYSVGDVYLTTGDSLRLGAVVMALETPTLAVTADVAINEIDEFSVGDTVVVEQLDETTFEAVVTSIADVANAGDGQDTTPTLTVTFDVVTEPDDFVSGSVTISSESSRIDDATVVPSRALLTLSEGGYAVEKQLADGTTELVGVEIGAFDDGMVEIVSVTVGDLTVGDDIVVPS